jgi:thioredoxin-related protein
LAIHPCAVKKLLLSLALLAAILPAPALHAEWTTDYQAALDQAKAQNKLVLLDFTGSDWCPYCQLLHKEVLAQPAFTQFANQNYILVMLDFPHQKLLPDDVKQQNDDLQRQFRVGVFPTLIVVKPDGKGLGRLTGYNPGSGPQAVISQLKALNRKRPAVTQP